MAHDEATHQWMVTYSYFNLIWSICECIFWSIKCFFVGKLCVPSALTALVPYMWWQWWDQPVEGTTPPPPTNFFCARFFSLFFSPFLLCKQWKGKEGSPKDHSSAAIWRSVPGTGRGGATQEVWEVGDMEPGSREPRLAILTGLLRAYMAKMDAQEAHRSQEYVQREHWFKAL